MKRKLIIYHKNVSKIKVFKISFTDGYQKIFSVFCQKIIIDF